MAGACLPVLHIGRQAAAAELAPLDPNDPTAKSLGYRSDSSKVDAYANPTYKPDQTCASCAQFQGKPGEQQGGCNIFVGKSVARRWLVQGLGEEARRLRIVLRYRLRGAAWKRSESGEGRVPPARPGGLRM